MSRRRHSIAWRGAAGLALVLACVAGQPATAQEVTAYLSTDSVTVGDRFTLTLVAEHAFLSEATFPDPTQDSARFGDLEVLAVAASGSRYLGTDDPGARRDSVVYSVTTFALDTAYVAPLRVRFTAAEDTFSVASAGLILPVTSLVPPEATDVRDLAPLVAFPRPWWPYLLLALAVLLFLGVLFYVLRRRNQAPPALPPPPPEPEISPYDVARERLRALEAGAHLDDAEAVKPFFVELSDILRSYLEHRIGVPALERTTSELLRELEGRTVRYKLPGPAPARLREILQLADLAKFAKLTPPPAEGLAALDETRKTIDSVETKMRQVDADRAPLAPPPRATPLPLEHQGDGTAS